jgi:hypothetical protein
MSLMLTLILLVTQAGLANAAPITSDSKRDRLTTQEMASAIVVADALAARRSGVRGAVYRLQSCDSGNPEALCYFKVVDMTTPSRGLVSSMATEGYGTLAGTNATLTCGVPFYNLLGFEVAKLVQNVNVTFHTYNGQTPVTMNWGDRNGTYSYWPFQWQTLSGPYANPGFGVYVSRGGTAYAQTDGVLKNEPYSGFPGGSVSVSLHLTINSGGWWCQ